MIIGTEHMTVCPLCGARPLQPCTAAVTHTERLLR